MAGLEGFASDWRVAAAILGGMVFATPACAAIQGEISVKSTASLQISVSVAPRIGVSGLADTALVATAGNQTASALQSACIATNSATGAYSLTGTGSGADGAFVLAAADGAEVPLVLSWSGQALVAGEPLAASAQGCGAALAVAAQPGSDMSGAGQPDPAQPAAGLLTLTFAPL
jgi:hypothetical protein